MRLSDYFPQSSISVIHSAKDWQEAIDFSMVSLLDKNYISENYIQAIKDSTINNGPYYILAPGVAGSDSNLLIVFYVQIMPDD
ncbi:PTS sugar transporter subunit IIA, partial [Escherichia coli]|uniref:PTS sugar transporter subunit IIA n=1 Tax=Escherichia coli TaxID=562 RepID=UPI0012FFA521